MCESIVGNEYEYIVNACCSNFKIYLVVKLTRRKLTRIGAEHL